MNGAFSSILSFGRTCRRSPAVWRATIALALLANVPTSAAQATGDDEEESSIYDDIWKFADWYDNDENKVIQRLQFSGRFQLDYATVDAEEGDHDEWNIRRFRLGARARLFHHFTLHGEVELNPQEADPLFNRFTDLYFQWNKSARFEATIGKHGAPFTMDGSTSSKELLTIDRSNLTNNFWFTQEYLPGLSVSGEPGLWSYHAGVYSTGSEDRVFGKFDGSYFGLFVVSYDFAERLRVKEAVLAANYVYQDPDERNSFTRDLENILSVNFELEAGQWGLRADLSGATGFASQSDLWGAMAMPFYHITEEVQLIGRYTYVSSRDPNGVRLNRYERSVVSGLGDRYNELYVGANWFIYGHKLKVQVGYQFADMRDLAGDGGAYSGNALTIGFRTSW